MGREWWGWFSCVEVLHICLGKSDTSKYICLGKCRNNDEFCDKQVDAENGNCSFYA